VEGHRTSPDGGLTTAVPKKYREVRRILRRAGWSIARTTGSHEQWRSFDGTRSVTVSGKPSDTVPAGTLAAMRRATGLDDLR
jgi:predicted RNA binding protein YcfA (HicA-like mRNA interferase family)